MNCNTTHYRANSSSVPGDPTSSRCGYDGDRRPLVRSLVALGIDPNGADAAGDTPIFGLTDERLLALLLSLGARADHRNEAGRNAVFSWTDVIALTLLDAGASPLVRDEKGRTLRQHARDKDMRGTLAWLDRHGVQ